MKKIVSIAIAAIMIASLVSVFAIPSSADQTIVSKYTGELCVDTSWYDNNQSATEFHLTTAGQLAGLAELVNTKYIEFQGCTIYLDCDIVWNEGTLTADENGQPLYNGNPVTADNMPNAFTPIGYHQSKDSTTDVNAPVLNPLNVWFKGSFDGQGHVISGLYINEPLYMWNGLFTVFAGPSIKNCSIINSYIGGDSRVGSFAGIFIGTVAKAAHADEVDTDIASGNCTIAENLFSNAYVSGYGTQKNSRSGGVFGIVRNYDKNDDIGLQIKANGGVMLLKNCWFDGTVYGGEAGRFCGGISANACGYAKSEDTDLGIFDIVYENCLMTGSIISMGKTNGGMCSEVYMTDATFKNCLSAPKALKVGVESGIIAANGTYTTNKLARVFVENSFCVTPATVEIKDATEDFVLQAFPAVATYHLTGAEGTLIPDVYSASALNTIFNLSGPSINGIATELSSATYVDSPAVRQPGEVTTEEETSFVFITDEETNPPSTAAPKPTTTTEKPADTSVKPTDESTTAAPAPSNDSKGCGGFTAVAAMMVVVLGAVSVVVIKKK